MGRMNCCGIIIGARPIAGLHPAGPQPAPILPGTNPSHVMAHAIDRLVHSASLRIEVSLHGFDLISAPMLRMQTGAMRGVTRGASLRGRSSSGHSHSVEEFASRSKSGVVERVLSCGTCTGSLGRLVAESTSGLITEAQFSEKGKFRWSGGMHKLQVTQNKLQCRTRHAINRVLLRREPWRPAHTAALPVTRSEPRR
jgi:hypothetical protein